MTLDTGKIASCVWSTDIGLGCKAQPKPIRKAYTQSVTREGAGVSLGYL